jgi:glycosyltransferase involved in cell wall biosynthesis
MIKDELLVEECSTRRVEDEVLKYSKLLSTQKNLEIISDFIDFLNNHYNELSLDNKYFLFSQINCLIFLTPEFNSLRGKLYLFYQRIYKDYLARIEDDLSYIPIIERNPNFSVVICGQVLSVKHGPTKTTFDRIKVLKKKFKQEVLLINTATVMSPFGAMPFFDARYGNYIPEYSDKDTLEMMGISVPFFQCDQNMPDIPTMELLIDQIRKLKPRHIISIGNDIFADIVNNFIPVLTVGLVPSSLSYTLSSFQTLSRDLTKDENILMHKLGLSEQNVIKSIFTSGLKVQSEHTNRKSLGLPNDKFIIAVVGGRLGYEVTDEFLGMLEWVLENRNIYIVFMGYFSDFEEKMNRHISLKSHVKYLGMVDDILSRIELIDLYVNPVRRGGGTSSVEALSKGVPAVTTDYGDVAVNVGKDFFVKDYDDMAKTIIRYIDDKTFYESQSKKALDRSKLLLDSDGQFVKLMNEYEKREKEMFEG